MEAEAGAGKRLTSGDEGLEFMAFLKTERPWRFLSGPLLFALAVIIFRNALFTREEIFLSNRECDIFHQFMQWREFGFSELRRGNIALWNPYLFAGAPYFGTFQAALFYSMFLAFYGSSKRTGKKRVDRRLGEVLQCGFASFFQS